MLALLDPFRVFWGVGCVHRVLLPSPTALPVDPAYDFVAKTLFELEFASFQILNGIWVFISSV